MRFEKLDLPGVILVEPDVHRDDRGFFLESFHAGRYAEAGIGGPFVQDNHSRSQKGILRGLHGQFPHCQGKLVRVIAGEVFDVAVDARRGSPTYGRHVSLSLSSENFRQLWVPPGFVHGFCVTSDFAEFEYKCTDVYHPEDEFSVAWNDPDLGIEWPVIDPILSPKDLDAPRLRDVQHLLIEYRG